MKHRILITAIVASLALAQAPAHAGMPAQAPKPPTDAKKVVQKPTNGRLTYTADAFAVQKLDTQAKDFDVSFTVANPAVVEFVIGIDFRAVTFSRFYLLYLVNTGETGLAIERDFGQVADLKGPTFAPSWKKNVGEKNDVALYVRGGQGWLFINKQFVEQYDVSEINDFGDLHLFAAGPKGQGGDIEYTNLTVKVPNNALPPTASGPTNNNIVVSLYRSGYNQWDRPAGMDDPRKGCSAFDDGRPVLQFQAVMKVTNNTKLPMKRWVPLALKRDGKLAFGCALGYDKSPVIAPGASADITIEYYIDKSDAISGIFVFDVDQGRSNRLQTPAP